VRFSVVIEMSEILGEGERVDEVFGVNKFGDLCLFVFAM
jgi:hypothetical protein